MANGAQHVNGNGMGAHLSTPAPSLGSDAATRTSLGGRSLLAVGCGNTIGVYLEENLSVFQLLHGHEDTVTGLAFGIGRSRDRLVSCDEKQIIVWQFNKSQQGFERVLSADCQPSQFSCMQCVSFIRNGWSVLIGCKERLVEIPLPVNTDSFQKIANAAKSDEDAWNPEVEVVADLPGFSCRRLSVSPDGTWALVWQGDGVAHAVGLQAWKGASAALTLENESGQNGDDAHDGVKVVTAAWNRSPIFVSLDESNLLLTVSPGGRINIWMLAGIRKNSVIDGDHNNSIRINLVASHQGPANALSAVWLTDAEHSGYGRRVDCGTILGTSAVFSEDDFASEKMGGLQLQKVPPAPEVGKQQWFCVLSEGGVASMFVVDGLKFATSPAKLKTSILHLMEGRAEHLEGVHEWSHAWAAARFGPGNSGIEAMPSSVKLLAYGGGLCPFGKYAGVRSVQLEVQKRHVTQLRRETAITVANTLRSVRCHSLLPFVALQSSCGIVRVARLSVSHLYPLAPPVQAQGIAWAGIGQQGGPILWTWEAEDSEGGGGFTVTAAEAIEHRIDEGSWNKLGTWRILPNEGSIRDICINEDSDSTSAVILTEKSIIWLENSRSASCETPKILSPVGSRICCLVALPGGHSADEQDISRWSCACCMADGTSWLIVSAGKIASIVKKESRCVSLGELQSVAQVNTEGQVLIGRVKPQPSVWDVRWEHSGLFMPDDWGNIESNKQSVYAHGDGRYDFAITNSASGEVLVAGPVGRGGNQERPFTPVNLSNFLANLGGVLDCMWSHDGELLVLMPRGFLLFQRASLPISHVQVQRNANHLVQGLKYVLRAAGFRVFKHCVAEACRQWKDHKRCALIEECLRVSEENASETEYEELQGRDNDQSLSHLGLSSMDSSEGITEIGREVQNIDIDSIINSSIKEMKSLMDGSQDHVFDSEEQKSALERAHAPLKEIASFLLPLASSVSAVCSEKNQGLDAAGKIAASLMLSGNFEDGLAFALSSDATAALCAAVAEHNPLHWVVNGVGIWMEQINDLRAHIEKAAKASFLENKDAMDAVLLYVALKKPRALSALFKASRDNRMADFFAHDFDEPRWQSAALKNGYALVAKHKYHVAAGFFLLGGAVEDAVKVCLDRMNNAVVAITVARLMLEDEDKHKQIIAKLVFPYCIKPENVHKLHAVAVCCLWLCGAPSQAWRALHCKQELQNCTSVMQEIANRSSDAGKGTSAIETGQLDFNAFFGGGGGNSFGIGSSQPSEMGVSAGQVKWESSPLEISDPFVHALMAPKMLSCRAQFGIRRKGRPLPAVEKDLLSESVARSFLRKDFPAVAHMVCPSNSRLVATISAWFSASNELLCDEELTVPSGAVNQTVSWLDKELRIGLDGDVGSAGVINSLSKCTARHQRLDAVLGLAELNGRAANVVMHVAWEVIDVIGKLSMREWVSDDLVYKLSNQSRLLHRYISSIQRGTYDDCIEREWDTPVSGGFVALLHACVRTIGFVHAWIRRSPSLALQCITASPREVHSAMSHSVDVQTDDVDASLNEMEDHLRRKKLKDPLDIWLGDAVTLHRRVALLSALKELKRTLSHSLRLSPSSCQSPSTMESLGSPGRARSLSAVVRRGSNDSMEGSHPDSSDLDTKLESSHGCQAMLEALNTWIESLTTGIRSVIREIVFRPEIGDVSADVCYHVKASRGKASLVGDGDWNRLKDFVNSDLTMQALATQSLNSNLEDMGVAPVNMVNASRFYANLSARLDLLELPMVYAGKLSVTVHEARIMESHAKSSFRSLDPFLVVWCDCWGPQSSLPSEPPIRSVSKTGAGMCTTSVMHRTSNPQWEELLEADIRGDGWGQMRVWLMDRRKLGADEEIGCAVMSIASCVESKAHELNISMDKGIGQEAELTAHARLTIKAQYGLMEREGSECAE